MFNKIKKLAELMGEYTIYLLMLVIISGLIVTVYTNIKIDNKIKEPEHCLKINDGYYCKVEG